MSLLQPTVRVRRKEKHSEFEQYLDQLMAITSKCRWGTWREFTRTCRVSSDMMNWGMGTIRWNPFRLDTSTAMRSYTNERTLLYPVNKHWFIYYIHIAREAKLQAPVQRVPNGISFLILSPWSLNYIRSRT